MIKQFSCSLFNRFLALFIHSTGPPKRQMEYRSAAGKVSGSAIRHRKSWCVISYKGLLNCIWNDTICRWFSDSFFHYSSIASVKKDYQHKNNCVFGTCSMIEVASATSLWEYSHFLKYSFKILWIPIWCWSFLYTRAGTQLFWSLKLVLPLEQVVQQSWGRCHTDGLRNKLILYARQHRFDVRIFLLDLMSQLSGSQ